MTGTIRLLSIIVPVFDEQDVISEFNRRILDTLSELQFECDLIYVNDGSRDRTPEIIRGFMSQQAHVSLIDLSRNFGKEAAMTAGLDHATGDAVVIIDADLQDPPELIRDMVGMYMSGDFDVIYAQRTSRRGETFVKKATAHLFYRVIGRLTGIDIPRDTGDFRLMNRRAVDALLQLREHHRFMKGLFAWIGFRQAALPYDRDPRFAGKSKFNYWRLWNFSLEGITSFTTAPLKIAAYLGLVTSVGAAFYGIGIVLGTLLFGNPVAGYPSLLVVVLFFGGLQLLTLGIIGEYLGRIFNEAKHRPLYFVREIIPRRAHAPGTGISAPQPTDTDTARVRAPE